MAPGKYGGSLTQTRRHYEATGKTAEFHVKHLRDVPDDLQDEKASVVS